MHLPASADSSYLKFSIWGLPRRFVASQAATCNISKVNLQPVCSPRVDAPLKPCSTYHAPLQVQAS